MTISKFGLLDSSQIDDIKNQAFEILESKGVFVENKECRVIFAELGIKHNEGWFKITKDLIRKSIQNAPKTVKLYNREGSFISELGGDAINFNPGSTALSIFDVETGKIRQPSTYDYINYAKIVDQMNNIAFQSTAMICSDVPKEISDAYRLYLSLLFSSKPIVTGTFRKESFALMKNLLMAVRGDEEKLKQKPLAIFDACTTSPIRWSDLTCQSVIDAARSGIPSEIISMPMMGANTPASMYSSTVIHTAELMSGIVISQIAEKGSPVIWGGSASVFDLQKGTTPIGAIESMMMSSAYAQIGKSLDLPTHGYMGLSDSKVIDMQAGFETGFGLLFAAISNFNMISGAGMIDFQSTFSLEKLIIDNEIIGMVNRFNDGIKKYENISTKDILDDYDTKKQFLTHPTTRQNYKKEYYFPSKLIDRGTRDSWDGVSIDLRAQKSIKSLLNSYENTIDDQTKLKLIQTMGITGFTIPDLF